MMKSFLSVERLSVRFGAVNALETVNLELGVDELLVVLGPTGAGKTTLLRTLAGLESAAAGQVKMAGVDVTRWPPAARDVALVFQNFSLYPDWTVRRNLEFPLLAPGRDLAADDVEARIAWAADLLQISYLLERPAAQLSGGEMQRVAVGRALVRRPRLFLLDEPLTNLDAKLRERLRVELAVLRRDLGIPMIYVTHDQAEALSMGDRIAVLSAGKVLQVGTPEEVYRAPATPLVARQLGQPRINLFTVRSEGGYWVTDRGVRIVQNADVRMVSDKVGGVGSTPIPRAVCGVRPADIAPLGGEVPGTVRVVEDAGATRILIVDWQGHDIHLQVGKDRLFHPGDTVAPRFGPDRAIVWSELH